MCVCFESPLTMYLDISINIYIYTAVQCEVPRSISYHPVKGS